MPISCGRVVIDGYIYTINLEFRDELGNVQTDMRPIDETEEQPKELIKKINDIVAKLKESLQSSPNPKPLSSYKCIQINNAGIKLDGNELAWNSTSIQGIHHQWTETAGTLGELRAQLQLLPVTPSVASSSTTIDFTVENDSDAPPSPPASSLDLLSRYIDEFSLDDLGLTAPNKINTIWNKVGEHKQNDQPLASRERVTAFLRIVNKLAAQERDDKQPLRDAVLNKLREFKQSDSPHQQSLVSRMGSAASSFFSSSSTAQSDNWKPTADNLAQLVKTLREQLGNLYDTANSFPTAQQIMTAHSRS